MHRDIKVASPRCRCHERRAALHDLQAGVDGEEDEEFEGSANSESDSDSGSDAELIAEDGISAEAVTGTRTHAGTCSDSSSAGVRVRSVHSAKERDRSYKNDPVAFSACAALFPTRLGRS